jgi:hypothetical protein
MIPGLIASLYGMDEADHVERRLRETISKYRGTIHQPADTGLSERDCMLITYGDQVQTPANPSENAGVIFTQACRRFDQFMHTFRSIHGLPMMDFP